MAGLCTVPVRYARERCAATLPPLPAHMPAGEAAGDGPAAEADRPARLRLGEAARGHLQLIQPLERPLCANPPAAGLDLALKPVSTIYETEHAGFGMWGSLLLLPLTHLFHLDHFHRCATSRRMDDALDSGTLGHLMSRACGGTHKTVTA